MNEKLTNFFAYLLKIIPEFLTYGAVFCMILDDFIARILTKPPIIQAQARLSLIALSLVGLVLTFHAYRRKIDASLESFNQQSGVEELIPSSQSLDLETIIRKSKTIKILSLAGTKLAQLGETTVLNEIRKESKGKNITILLANPYSEAIITRYRKDEPSHYETGLNGLKRRLYFLNELVDQQMLSAQTLIIKVYDNYPTCSIVQGDKDIFSTTYGYHLRGADCPKLHATIGGIYSDFLLTHFDNIYNDAVSLNEWVKQHPKGD